MSGRTKYDQLHYREMPGERLRNEWLRCQIGILTLKRAEPVFHLLGYGKTMPDAEEMVERKLEGRGRRSETGGQL
jgi:hypothetical protein